jgi:hypothetical protein
MVEPLPIATRVHHVSCLMASNTHCVAFLEALLAFIKSIKGDYSSFLVFFHMTKLKQS